MKNKLVTGKHPQKNYTWVERLIFFKLSVTLIFTAISILSFGEANANSFKLVKQQNYKTEKEFGSVNEQQAEKSVSGKVTDTSGETLPGFR